MKTVSYCKKGCCVVLAGAMLLLTTACDRGKTVPTGGPSDTTSEPKPAYSDEAGTVRKSETVYVTMDATGAPTSKLVTDWLHTDKADVHIRDKSDLTDIVNVKGNEQPTRKGDTLTWNVAGTDLYYQGKTDKALPVDIRIRYRLDGREIAPAELAGRSGKVTIEITMTNTDARAVEVGGKTVTMYTPVQAAGGLILPEETFSNVVVENGALLADGSKQVAAFLCLPGLDKSLDLSGSDIAELKGLSFPESFTITADAKAFALSNMAFVFTTAVPELEELGQDSTSLDDIRENLYDLRDMQNRLETMDPDRVLRSLFTDAKSVAGAKTLTDDLSAFYGMDTELLDVLPELVTEENLSLFDRLRRDAKDAKIDALLANDGVLSLLDQLDAQGIAGAKTLMADVQALRGLDMDRLTGVIGLLGGADQLAALLQDSSALAGSVADNVEAVNTLEALLGCSDEAMALVGNMQTLMTDLNAQGITVTADDIDYLVGQLVAKKATEQAAVKLHLTTAQLTCFLKATVTELVPDNGELTADQRTIGAVSLGMAIPQMPAQQQEALKPLLTLLSSSGPIPALDAATVATLRAVETQAQAGVKKQLADGLTAAEQQSQAIAGQVKALLAQANALGAKLDQIGLNKVQQSLHFVTELMPSLNELVGRLQQNQDQLTRLETLLADEETMAYLQATSERLVAMKKDLDANAKNLELLAKVLEATEDPSMQAFAAMLPTLRQDLNDAKPVLEALAGDLDNPAKQKQLKNAPQTVATLMKMKVDLEANRQITDALKLATTGRNTAAMADMIGTLDRLEGADTVGGYIRTLESADTLKARAQAYVQLAEDYGVFSEAADGMETAVKFVCKTDAIQPVKTEEEPQEDDTNAGGLVAWFKDLFGKK